MFSINLKHTKALLKKIGDANLKIDFSAELHLNNVDDELLDLCNYAKFVGLKFGIESAHKKIRDSVNELISNEGHDRREVVSFFSEVLNDTRIVNNFEGPNSSHECIEAITDLILSYKRHC